MPTEDKKPDLLSGTNVEKELAKDQAALATNKDESKDTVAGASSFKKKLRKKSFGEFTNGKLKE